MIRVLTFGTYDSSELVFGSAFLRQIFWPMVGRNLAAASWG
jgi:hypothetical protein